MKITALDVVALKLPAHGTDISGGAGISGAPSRASGVRGDYIVVPPYRTAFSADIETLVVRIETDTGLVGYGEAQAPILASVPKIIIERLLRPLIMGSDPFDSDVLWHRMHDANRDRGHDVGHHLDAISAIDLALWDLKGKATGLPVCQLLGGAHRQRVKMYYSGLTDEDRDGQCRQARQAVSDGFTGVKVFLGRGITEDVSRARALIGALGEDARLLVDAHWMYGRIEAYEVGLELQRLGARWLEAPLVREDVTGMAELASKLRLPIAAGEGERSLAGFHHLLRSRAVDILQPDVGRAGGLTQCRTIAALADAYHTPVAPHCGVGVGPYIAASVHFAAAIHDFEILEYQPAMYAAMAKVAHGPQFEVSRGTVRVPDRPGLGVDLDDAALSHFAVDGDAGR